MTHSRRQFLGAAGAVIGAPAAMQLNNMLAAHGVRRVGGEFLGGIPTGRVETARDNPVQLFFHFRDWWDKFGRERAERDADGTAGAGLDADLLSMRSPSLDAKMRMQKKRIVERMRREREKEFTYQLSMEGVFKWWP